METVPLAAQPEKNSQAAEALTTRQLFDLDALETLRSQQRLQYDEALSINLSNGLGDSLASGFATNVVDSATDNYVKQGTFESDAAEKSAYDAIRSLAFDKIPDGEWYAGPIDDQTGEQVPSGRDRARHLFEETTHEQYYAFDQKTEEDLTTLEARKTELKSLRDELATLAAKRQGRLYGKGGEAYEAARQDYNDHLITLGKLENESIINDTQLSDDEKKRKITEYLFSEQAELRNETLKRLKGTNVGRFVEFMNKGNVAVRIAKGIGFGALVGIAGAGVGALAGVAGAAAIGTAVATGAAALTRFTRGFASSRANQGEGMSQLDPANYTDETTEVGDYFDTTQRHLDNHFETDIENEQGNVRRSALIGAGAIVLGGVVVGAVEFANSNNLFNGWTDRSLLPPAEGPEQPDSQPAPEQPEPDPQPAPEQKPPETGDDGAKAPAEAPREALPNVDGGGNWAPGGVDNYITGDLGTTEFTPAGLDNFHQWVDGYSVRPGDSIWSLSEDYLRTQGVANPSVYQIDAVKDTVLADFQARGLVGANGWLSAGQSLHVK